MAKKKNSMYHRLDKSDRVAIERGLDKGKSCRQIAQDLGRAASTIHAEVARNRIVTRGKNKGECAKDFPQNVCPRLNSWPHACNGCNKRHYHCNRPFKCEYQAVFAQCHAEDISKSSRAGVDMNEEKFLEIIDIVRKDLSRGLSPEQIVMERGSKVHVSVSTLYRWLDLGYAGMSNMDLRRKCGYKPRKHTVSIKPTSHGADRSYNAFCKLSEEQRDSTVEMDTVHGRIRDSQCLLTLYARPMKFQLTLLMPDKTPTSTQKEFDRLESILGIRKFMEIFNFILTDNGIEFSNFAALEQSCVQKNAKRCSIFYCDVRQSQQKGACERNHVELRKILPKGRTISFDRLSRQDCSVLMSHLNSQPRKSLSGMTPIDMFIAAHGDTAKKLLEAYGIEKIPFDELEMTPKVIEKAKAARGEQPLID